MRSVDYESKSLIFLLSPTHHAARSFKHPSVEAAVDFNTVRADIRNGYNSDRVLRASAEKDSTVA